MDLLCQHVQTFCRRLRTDGLEASYANVSGPGPSPALAWLLESEDANVRVTEPAAPDEAPAPAAPDVPAPLDRPVDNHHPDIVGPTSAYPTS